MAAASGAKGPPRDARSGPPVLPVDLLPGAGRRAVRDRDGSARLHARRVVRDPGDGVEASRLARADARPHRELAAANHGPRAPTLARPVTDTLDRFPHRFEPGAGADVTLLALHGTGGDENDLLPLARAIRPRAAVLSPRGRVLEHGMPRFFRRLAEGVFDQEDLKLRTSELTEFIASASSRYGFDPAR